MVRIKTHCGSKRLRTVSQPTAALSPNIFQHLPFEILEQIISFLPIRQAKQQCILSSEFRSSTHISRRFLFGRVFSKRRSRESIVELVDHLFATHRGLYIDAFQIYIDPVGIENFIQKWLEICREKRIQELELFFVDSGFTLTADFLNQLFRLSTLKLVHCNLELPVNLLSLANLRNLILWFVPLKDENIHTLISHCRQLVTVDLLYCTEVVCVEIYAREHKFLKRVRVARCKNVEVFVVDSATIECVHYRGHVPTRIRFFQTTKLNEAYLNFVPAGSRGYFQASVLENLVSDIPHVKILSASALVPEIDDYTFDCGPYWEFHQKSKMEKFDLCFDRLNYIKLRGFKFIAAELQLAKILLQKTTHLDALVLVSQKNCVANICTPYGRKYDQLFHSWKASPEAKIVTFEHTDDPGRSSSSHSKEWLFSSD
ncbi:hypothetical protein ACSQ67_013110 [Phaseolus vulgaris]